MPSEELIQKIEHVWNLLDSSGLSNPVTAVGQITYLIFIKSLDDSQIKDESNYNILHQKMENKTFPDEGEYIVPNTDGKMKIPFRELRWSVFHNYAPQRIFDIISQYVFPFIKGLSGDGDTAFSKYMDKAVFQITDPETLHSVIDTIDSMNLEDKDAMGDVYEYLLSKLAVAGRNGQFRTPRHIINMMVQLMKPTLDDKILDPAMGTGGFLVGAATYLENNYKKELMNTEKSKYFAEKMFTGFDCDDTMVGIGAMNLMLHGIDKPNIRRCDSLSKVDNPERSGYTLILANPPFSAKSAKIRKDNVSSDLTKITDTTKTELLFVALFIKMLKVGGRCACIVPEGLLFGRNPAILNLRKELVDKQKLRAVIHMPKGVFMPYTDVSTGILIFDRTDNGGTDNVWFYDMKSDGFTLNKKRKPTSNNDIPDILERFENPDEVNRTRRDQSFYVSIDEIKNNNYVLLPKLYKEIVYDEIKYPEPSQIISEIDEYSIELEKNLDDLKKIL